MRSIVGALARAEAYSSGRALQRSVVRHRHLVAALIHSMLIAAGFSLAFLLRFDGDIPPKYQVLFWTTLPFIVVLRLAALAAFGVLRSHYRYVGMQDLTDLLKAVAVSSIAFSGIVLLASEHPEFPKSILVLDFLIAILVIGGMRFLLRRVRERTSATRFKGKLIRTIVVGAGDTGESLLRQLDHDGRSNLRVVGVVDDDPAKRDLRLHGAKVLGSSEDLEHLIVSLRVQLVVFAVPSLSHRQMQRLVERCGSKGVEFKIVPSIREILAGKARLSHLREVAIADLLGRAPVELDLDRVRNSIEGKVVLITGAAGSIGSELARQIAEFDPALLVLLDQAESRLYFVTLDLEKRFPDLRIRPIICDVKDQRRLGQVFAECRPDIVFHAAAYKHVPMMEVNVLEAVQTNVFGTLSVVQCCVRHDVVRLVLISTDKAVLPSSVMGASKRIAERIALSWPSLVSARTDFRVVRFGNVLDSDGSVVPLFKQQIAAGGPVTVTDSRVTRYFMTIPEAVQLVLQASILPEAAGRISLLEMGEPVRILDLAENLIRLSGLEPYREIPIIFTGLRPGEKLHEELLSAAEATVATSLPQVRVVRTDDPEPSKVEEYLQRLISAVEMGDIDATLQGIFALVPECVSPLREHVLRSQRLSSQPRRIPALQVSSRTPVRKPPVDAITA
jgi:FlaA1/EpsC-like NDP-sugar epimerase